MSSRCPRTFLADATAYSAIYCFGLVFQFAYNIVSFILRSLGDSAATLYFLLVSSVTNIVLDLVFCHLPALGRARRGDCHGDCPGVVCGGQRHLYVQTLPHSSLSKGEFRFHRKQAAQALRLSIPTTLQQCIVSSGHIAIQRIVNDFGLTAAFTAGMRMENFIMIPIFSFNVGIATFTGQNVGAGRLDRVRRGFRATQIMGLAVCAVVGVLAFTLASPLVGLFGVEGSTQAIAAEYLRFIAPCLLLFCFYIITNGVLQGSGDVIFTAVNTVSNLAIRCAAAYLLAYLTPLEGRAAWVSLPISWTYALVLSLVRYKRGKWRKKAVATSSGPELPQEEVLEEEGLS